MIDDKSRGILEAVLPEDVREANNYLIKTKQMLLTPEQEEKELQEEFQFDPKVEEAINALSTTVAASSGAMKVIEQLYGSKASVVVDQRDKKVRAAIKRIFKINSSEITFDMYKQAVGQLRSLANFIHDEVVNEQSKPYNE